MNNDGNRYKHCIAWRMFPGHGFACFEMCSQEQRKACSEQHTADTPVLNFEQIRSVSKTVTDEQNKSS